MTGNTVMLDDLRPARIREAALAEALERGRFCTDHQVYSGVANRLGSSLDNLRYRGRGYERNREQERFFGRVDRALKALAEEGRLRRTGRDERGPDGTRSRFVMYWTPEKWAVAEAERAIVLAGLAETEARWAKVAERLGAQEILMTRQGHLSLSSWERLLDRAGW